MQLMFTLILVWLNLALGVILWLGLCSDWSLPGTVPDIIFPIAVFVIAFISAIILISVVKKDAPRKQLAFNVLACLPSLIGGGLFMIFLIVYLLPPMTLVTGFWLDEVKSEKLVQQLPSPNGWTVAYAYFRPVGAYAAGEGRIIIKVKYRYLPLVERQIYQRTSYVAQDELGRTSFVRWLDNDTILAIERNDIIKVGLIRFKSPLSP